MSSKKMPIAKKYFCFHGLDRKKVGLKRVRIAKKNHSSLLKTAIAFNHRQKALDFEKYLKSPSGRAFAKKRL